MRFLGLIVLISALIQCHSNDQPTITRKELKEPLIQENIKITREESRIIDRYVERRGWDMKVSGTGLRYMIYEKGEGLKAEEKMQAAVEYEISLLDGTICYTSEGKGPKIFLIGKDNVESGIHEGVTYMRVGDRARFILPSYLAHGITGDGNKIPPRSSLIVDLHLVKLN